MIDGGPASTREAEARHTWSGQNVGVDRRQPERPHAMGDVRRLTTPGRGCHRSAVSRTAHDTARRRDRDEEGHLRRVILRLDERGPDHVRHCRRAVGADRHLVWHAPVLRMTMEPIRHAFVSMGTRVQLIAAPESDGRDVARALRRVRRIFAREDVRFSRFRPDSELSTVNAQAGEWVPVSAPFATLIRMALKAARDTDGLFDPTVLPALMAARIRPGLRGRGGARRSRGRGASSHPARVRRPDDQERHRVRRLAGRRA